MRKIGKSTAFDVMLYGYSRQRCTIGCSLAIAGLFAVKFLLISSQEAGSKVRT